MTWLVPKLRHRIQIRKPVQTPNTAGGYDRSYTTLTTIWAEIKSLKGIREFVPYIRGESLSELPTHECRVRLIAVQNLHKGYTKGFTKGFDSVADLSPLKKDHFIFIQKGSTFKGRLFQIANIKHDEERSEYIRFRVREVEEHGTGYPA
jgi:hypothetical protein